MFPANAASTLVGNYLRAQQGVLESVQVAPDDIRLSVGEKVQALVTNQLNNGRFAVLIKNQLLDLNLPRNTQPGQQFELTVLAKSPELTFRLEAQQLAKPILEQPANVALSKGATLISSLFAQSGGGAQAAALIEGADPLFTQAPDPKALAGQLAQRLATSGLFYESHQAQWVNGERALPQILAEPQARLHSMASADPAQPVATKETLTIPAANNPQSRPEAMAASAGSPSDKVAEANLQQLVRQQLELVENKPLIWQGAAWPGQPLRWELELANDKEAQGAAAASRQWQTRLQLDLPRLGSVTVIAQLQDGQFNLRFQAENPATLQLLRAQQPEVMRRFAAAGLSLAAAQYQAWEASNEEAS
ncbi:flagellar hook-length control protein FliK [Chitinibacter sp. ZOR0017]|uniref:flagellar hook-length control protein FliK n=1 Tax=Chitinibacter sp. ZOR0017 TaxID=1339254 RepID=UPI0006473C33|nr:flagellar hook-length control protein FliK [Chitinibacter sp. ZOR0017]